MLDRRSSLFVLAAAVAATVALVPLIASRDSSAPVTASEYRAELREALDGFDVADVNTEDALGELAEHQLAGEEWIEAMNALGAKGYLTYPAP